MKPNPTYSYLNLLLILGLLLTSVFSRADSTVLYSNVSADCCEDRFPWDAGGRIGAGKNTDVMAQPFKTGASGTVLFRSIPAAKEGTVSGIGRFDVWDDNNGTPGKKLAELGEFDFATVPQRPMGTHLNFEDPVIGLKPNTTHHLVLNLDDVVISSGSRWRLGATVPSEGTSGIGKMLINLGGGTSWTTAASSIGNDRSYLEMEVIEPAIEEEVISNDLKVATTEDGEVIVSPELENYPAGTEVSVTAQPEEGLAFVKWTYGDEEFTSNPATITIKAGATLAPIFVQVVSGDIFVAPSEGGLFTVTPNLENYPIGSEISVMAEPEEGFEFVKWTYGDEEFTTNPASTTLKARATLTPVFAKKEAEPISIDITPAMAISWDSQVGTFYEIQSSTDLENWVVEAEGIEGTGETSTHFFLRTTSEIYYRVAETQ